MWGNVCPVKVGSIYSHHNRTHLYNIEGVSVTFDTPSIL